MIRYTMTKGLRHLREKKDWMTESNPQDQYVVGDIVERTDIS
jgi:hypothetical protein